MKHRPMNNRRLRRLYWSIGLSLLVILILAAAFFLPASRPWRLAALIASAILEIPIWLLQRK